MYFESREQAGDLLVRELYDKYRYENCVVIGVSDGGVVVAERITNVLHCALMMLITEPIAIPGEGLDLGSVDQNGGFTYNTNISESEASEYANEFHGYFEEQKREAFQRMNRLLGDGGVIDADLIRNNNVILVSDCISDVAQVDAALNYLKQIKIDRVVLATPIVTALAADKLHVSMDELHILDVKANFLDVNHYYTNNKVPSREEIIKKINQNILNWR